MVWTYIKAYIKADSFFRDYLPGLKNYKHKIRGKNGRGNPVEFTDQEKKEIKASVRKMAKDVTFKVK